MKKQGVKSTRKRKQAAAAQAEQVVNTNRRNLLKLMRNGAIGAIAIGAGGYFTLRSVRAHEREHDLTRVGQGKPTVVQVHDPRCPTCTALQKETRNALKQFGECDVLYLVADITSQTGAAFANRFGVPHVTLLLFDANGKLQTTLRGMRYRDELETVFAGHHAKHGSNSQVFARSFSGFTCVSVRDINRLCVVSVASAT